MVITYTKNNLVVGKESLVKLINIILFHIYQSQIQSVVLYQIAGTDRAIFLQNNSDFRILVMKCDEKLRKKTVLSIGEFRYEEGVLLSPYWSNLPEARCSTEECR